MSCCNAQNDLKHLGCWDLAMTAILSGDPQGPRNGVAGVPRAGAEEGCGGRTCATPQSGRPHRAAAGAATASASRTKSARSATCTGTGRAACSSSLAPHLLALAAHLGAIPATDLTMACMRSLRRRRSTVRLVAQTVGVMRRSAPRKRALRCGGKGTSLASPVSATWRAGFSQACALTACTHSRTTCTGYDARLMAAHWLSHCRGRSGSETHCAVPLQAEAAGVTHLEPSAGRVLEGGRAAVALQDQRCRDLRANPVARANSLYVHLHVHNPPCAPP